MTRTKLSDRSLPDYTKGEEIFNMVTHIVGGGFGIFALLSCVVIAALKGNVWGVIGSVVYGTALVMLYTMSSVYHGLRPNMGKKVMQVMDHCTIYFLIAGTYTPILLCSIREYSPILAWLIFGIEWGCAALGIIFTAIDLKRYNVLSMICYIGMGWCIIAAGKAAITAIGQQGFYWLLAGGIAYTIGAVLYGLGVKIRYMHSVFHIFVVLGSMLQYVCIIGYVL
jgi:hemolysin III